MAGLLLICWFALSYVFSLYLFIFIFNFKASVSAVSLDDCQSIVCSYCFLSCFKYLLNFLIIKIGFSYGIHPD